MKSVYTLPRRYFTSQLGFILHNHSSLHPNQSIKFDLMLDFFFKKKKTKKLLDIIVIFVIIPTQQIKAQSEIVK